jgi:hypothetical protein
MGRRVQVEMGLVVLAAAFGLLGGHGHACHPEMEVRSTSVATPMRLFGGGVGARPGTLDYGKWEDIGDDEVNDTGDGQGSAEGGYGITRVTKLKEPGAVRIGGGEGMTIIGEVDGVEEGERVWVPGGGVTRGERRRQGVATKAKRRRDDQGRGEFEEEEGNERTDDHSDVEMEMRKGREGEDGEIQGLENGEGRQPWARRAGACDIKDERHMIGDGDDLGFDDDAVIKEVFGTGGPSNPYSGLFFFSLCASFPCLS